MRYAAAALAAMTATIPAASQAGTGERWNVEIRDVYGEATAPSVDAGRLVGVADLTTGDEPKQVMLPAAVGAVPTDFTMSVVRVRGGYRLKVSQTIMTPSGPSSQTTELGFSKPGDVEYVAGFGSGPIHGEPGYMRGFVFRRL